MAAPDTLAVEVDSVEYSRYEKGNETISATITSSITGGGSFAGEEVVVELIKARRNRDAAVATATVTLTGSSPQRNLVTFYLPELVDQDEIHLVRHGKYFVQARYAATSATASIGSGANGTVDLTVDDEGADGNSYTVEVVVPGGTSALSVSQVGTAITVSLAVSGGIPVAADNTALLVANAINTESSDVTATATGTGVSSLSAAEGPTSFTGGTDAVSTDSDDFRISIVSVSRLKKDYLFGVNLQATNVMEPKFQPQTITGLTVQEVSQNHAPGMGTLTYNYHEDAVSNATASIGSGSHGTVSIEAVDALAGEDGNAVSVEVVVPAGTSGLSVSYAASTLTVSLSVNGGVPVTDDNRAFKVAAAIDALDNFSATFTGTGVDALASVSGPTLFTGGETREIRTLSWDGGESVSITAAGTYILPRGTAAAGNNPLAKLVGQTSQGYICVRVQSTILLPTESVTERLLMEKKPIDDETLARYVENAINWLEDVALAVYLEPTNVVTEPDPTSIQYTAGVGAPAPIFSDADFDFIKQPLTYFVGKNTQEWVTIQTPFMSILRVDNLFGAIANTRVIDLDLDWIEFSEKGGLIQLVPFNQEIAFDFIGLIWSNKLRGAVALPNFWHYNMIVGLRKCPSILQDVIGKKAAIDALTALGAAFRPGIGSSSISRDGVSESVSYNTQAQYGIYTGIITSYKEFIESELQKFKGAYRGATMVVV